MTLAFDERGTGHPAVVLLHGIGGGRAIWSHALDSLAAAGMRAIAVDLPGYGKSATKSPGGVHLMAAAVVNLLDALDLDKPVIVGHSMGGMVAQEIVAEWPGHVGGLVLACTSPAFGRPEGEWQAQFVGERLAPLDQGLGMAGLAARLVPGMVGPSADAQALAQAQGVMASVPEPTYRRVLSALVAFDRRAALPAIQAPTLCLAGEHDRTAPPTVLQGMAERIPDAEFQTLADAGHIANIEQPEAFDQAVVDFIRRRCTA